MANVDFLLFVYKFLYWCFRIKCLAFSVQPMEDSSYSTSSTSLHARSRKRKRLKQLAAEGEVGSPFGPKRRSAESSNISVNLNSFLDASYTPERSNLSREYLEKHHVFPW